jgi:hypothetical protein
MVQFSFAVVLGSALKLVPNRLLKEKSANTVTNSLPGDEQHVANIGQKEPSAREPLRRNFDDQDFELVGIDI